MRRRLLLSHLATAVVIAAVVRIIIGWMLAPQLQALPSENLQARHMLDDFGIVLLVIAILLATATFVVFEWSVRRRLTSFGQQLHGIATTTDRTARVATAGDDDMAGLAQPVNRLLGSLQSAQEHLKTSETRLSLALEAAGDGLWDYVRGEPTFFSQSYYGILGYPADSELLQPAQWAKLIHPDDASDVQDAIVNVRGGITDLLSVELRMRTAGGDWKWVYLRGRMILRGADGGTQRMIGTLQDIDERRRAEQGFRENQELFRNAFEESAIGMAMVRPDGGWIRVNSVFCAITGYSEAELLERTFQDITHPDDLQEDVEFAQTLLRGERRHYAMEKRYVRKDGQVVWVLLNVGVVLDAGQRPLYFVAQVQDIAERKRHEDDLRAYAGRLLVMKDELEHSTVELAAKTAEAQAANVAAAHAARTESAFLTNISHEIRTPMAAIIGFADLLLDNRLSDADRAQSIETIGRQGQHLLSLINDVLDLSKIEAGKMAIETIECDPARVVADVEAVMAARATDKGLPLIVSIAPDVPTRVWSDPTRLRQVLLNLVSNAIKFTHAGEVRIDLTAGVAAGGRVALRFAVTDTGIGMTEQELGLLFEPFSQADISTTRRFGGTGLGLAISKRLVEMMHGRIGVRSEVGHGSTFEMLIDASVCDAATPVTRVAGPTLRPGLRVLLADDGADNQRLISFYLRHAGIVFEIADNGRVAVDRAVAARAAGRPFDLVLMDMQMPEMDGYAATIALRSAGLTMPILALTAHATEEARAQSLRAGCCEHLIKPVEPNRLLSAIAEQTARGSIESP